VTRETICDTDADALLSANDRSNPRTCRGFDQRIGRIAGEEFHTFAFQNFSDDIDDFHGTSCF